MSGSLRFKSCVLALALTAGLSGGSSFAIQWLGGVDGDDWNADANWDGGLAPDVDFAENAEIGSGDNPKIIADLLVNPRFINVDGGTIDHTAGLVDLTNGGLGLGENIESLGPVDSVYNISGGELRIAAANFTDINIGLRSGSGTSALNISGDGFVNQASVQTNRGVRVGHEADGTLSIRDNGRLYTAGIFYNGGGLIAGVGYFDVYGGNVQIDADGGFRQDSVSRLNMHIDETGISPVNTIAGAQLNGYLSVYFDTSVSYGDSFTLMTTGTGVTGTFAKGAFMNGLGTNQRAILNYAGGVSGKDITVQIVAEKHYWLGGSSADNWNDANNWDPNALPNVAVLADAAFLSGANANVVEDLTVNPRGILIDGGVVNHTAGLVSLNGGGLNLGEDLEDLGQVHSEYNLSGGELRVAAANFTDVNIGLRANSGTNALNISGTGFLNQVSVSSGRGIRVGRTADGELSLSESAHVYTAGFLSNGGGDVNGVGLINITGGDVQIDVGGDFINDAVSTLQMNIDATGVSAINALGNATLDGFLSLNFDFVPTIGESFTIINTGGTVTGSFLGGVTATGLAAGTSVAVNYAGGDGNDVVLIIVEGILGDFTGNGIVDGDDFLSWQRGYGTTYADADLAAWNTNYGTGAAPAAVGAVPEPTAALLAALATACLATTRRGARSEGWQVH